MFNAVIAERTAAEPGVMWITGDDLCDCTFQRIGEWANPYLGKTLRVRMCCIWAELYKQFPQFVQECGYYDSNRHTYTSEAAEWDSTDMDMPVYLWHRQLATKTGKSIAEIRQEYAGRERDRPRMVAERIDVKPTADEVEYAHRQQLIASGWIVEGED